MRNRKRSFGAWSPLALIATAVTFGLYGETADPNAGGAGTGGGTGGATNNGSGGGTEGDKGAQGGGSAEQKPMPYEESRRLIAERDRAKAANRAITEALGLEVHVEHGEDGKPKVTVKGLDDLKTLRQQAQQAAEQARKNTGKWDEYKAELNTQHEKRLNELTQANKKLLGGRDAVINQLAVESPLREALSAEHIVAEAMDDAVLLLKGRLKVTIETDEETGAARPVVQPTKEDGTPLLDDKGNPIPIRQFAADFLAKKPHMRQSKFRSGPGAGGYGAGANQSAGGSGTPASGGAAAAAFLFGAKQQQ